MLFDIYLSHRFYYQNKMFKVIHTTNINENNGKHTYMQLKWQLGEIFFTDEQHNKHNGPRYTSWIIFSHDFL